MNKSDCQKAKIEAFKEKNKKILNDPLKKSFLESPFNNQLFEEAILSNFSNDKAEKLENAFKEHYYEIRESTYIKSTIRQTAIDYDKKHRKLGKRFLLTVDKPTSNDEKTSILDLLPSTELQHNEEKLTDVIICKTLTKALKSLTKQQLEIIDLCIGKDLPTKKVAEILNTTPQNVSNIKRKALGIIKKYVSEGD